ncbi:hypothetical protein SERLADRAFT_440392 [Serpula lacrymans var. lacrymans S7.9]|uniref:Uncharacterized protein n=1 Tax=Serpula lacrymans var. lacrymans (strain S7.9) TaxID=578457 RepID=F8P2I7_SERL9|nr:uncharacterized protein SERLADRAFT_440392 [Serpula lacrymans var. lacrymans S7.9]EGO22372.1 hypothetical protein SERLADRAFT_440392 [Serpula lacrymans var. lacrymans S7.9]
MSIRERERRKVGTGPKEQAEPSPQSQEVQFDKATRKRSREYDNGEIPEGRGVEMTGMIGVLSTASSLDTAATLKRSPPRKRYRRSALKAGIYGRAFEFDDQELQTAVRGMHAILKSLKDVLDEINSDPDE